MSIERAKAFCLPININESFGYDFTQEEWPTFVEELTQATERL